MTASTITFDLLDGIARDAAAAGLATYRSDDSEYLPAETAVVFAFMPQGPDRCLVLTDYPILDAGEAPLSQIRVQFRTRGLPNRPDDTWALRDGLYQLFQSLTNRTYGQVHVIQFLRISSIPLGPDSNQRFEYGDNYALDVDMPPTVNRPQ